MQGEPHGRFGKAQRNLSVRRHVDRCEEAAVEAGGRLVKRGEHAPGAPYAYVADPDGYLIEL